MAKEEPINILLVDDTPGKLLSYEVILQDLGENLIKVNSAKEALAELLRNEIAVILTDVCMPDLDGFEFASTRATSRRRSSSSLRCTSRTSTMCAGTIAVPWTMSACRSCPKFSGQRSRS